MDKNSTFTLHSLALPVKIGLTFVIVVNLLVILTFKLLIVRWTMRMGLLMPISVMTLIDESEKLITCALTSAIIIFDTIYGNDWIQETISTCPVRFMGLFGNVALFYGGLAISVMRIIFVQGRVFF